MSKLREDQELQEKSSLVHPLSPHFSVSAAMPNPLQQKNRSSLEILYMSGKSGVTNKELTDFIGLIALDVNNNPNIININHMKNLVFLDAGGQDCGISDRELEGMKIIDLCTEENPKISSRKN